MCHIINIQYKINIQSSISLTVILVRFLLAGPCGHNPAVDFPLSLHDLCVH